MRKLLTNEEFKIKSNNIHKNEYIYDKTNVNERDDKGRVCITCKKHGDFWIRPCNHLQGKGCKECGKEKLSKIHIMPTSQFIAKANTIHSHQYVYTKTDLNVRDEKGRVIVTCPKHGDFLVTPNNHLKGRGCLKCYLESKWSSREEFIEKANAIHNDKYDYSDVVYNGNDIEVNIKCYKHGIFKQTPSSHLQGHGCRLCYFESLMTTTIEFIERGKEIHNDKYIYSETDLLKRDEKGRVIIMCPIHGNFKQTPSHHLEGRGCPKCNSSKMEKEIRILLSENKIDFEEQKKFSWLGEQKIDFYLLKYNIAIECQGVQHFRPIDFFGGENGLLMSMERDKRKSDLCNENNVKLFYYSNLNIDFPYEVITDKEELIQTINKEIAKQSNGREQN